VFHQARQRGDDRRFDHAPVLPVPGGLQQVLVMQPRAPVRHDQTVRSGAVARDRACRQRVARRRGHRVGQRAGRPVVEELECGLDAVEPGACHGYTGCRRDGRAFREAPQVCRIRRTPPALGADRCRQIGIDDRRRVGEHVPRRPLRAPLPVDQRELDTLVAHAPLSSRRGRVGTYVATRIPA
jgi:hypothetical protein